ncbi:androgen-induced gene 1 protein-like [Sitophilus oryzae]|uniref:Androgen-induced gene 1 protein-like n=1 Tax=Sitophilus oryzae TaxID=7048 RepID=A0A6J2XKV3_SITOR|nr:androgen-induced gene 1 protein-like [Sitophilus oryzae]
MGIGKIGHFIIAAHFWFGCYYDWNYVKIPAELFDMGDSKLNSKKLKFLTYWDALLQSTFFTICFLNDIFGTNENFPKKIPFIRKLKDILLPALAFPISMFVGITFWGLYVIDRELVFPRAIDPYFPWWLNHLMHTNIVLFSITEMFTSYRKYPGRKIGFSIVTTFMVTYLIWIHILNSYTNRWVYPVLEVLNLPGRIAFFAFCLVLVIGLYIVGEKLNSLRWGTTLTSKKK